MFVPDLVGRVLQLLLVLADQDDVEAGLGQGQGVLLANTLDSPVVSKVSSRIQRNTLHTMVAPVTRAQAPYLSFILGFLQSPTRRGRRKVRKPLARW